MNKNNLIDLVSAETKMTKTDTQRVIEAIIEATRTTVKKGEPMRLVGFGTFVRAKRSARVARNPRTGKEVAIPPHSIPRFKPGSEFKDSLN
jgi:DNA-binding protein HU-beta